MAGSVTVDNGRGRAKRKLHRTSVLTTTAVVPLVTSTFSSCSQGPNLLRSSPRGLRSCDRLPTCPHLSRPRSQLVPTIILSKTAGGSGGKSILARRVVRSVIQDWKIFLHCVFWRPFSAVLHFYGSPGWASQKEKGDAQAPASHASSMRNAGSWDQTGQCNGRGEPQACVWGSCSLASTSEFVDLNPQMIRTSG